MSDMLVKEPGEAVNLPIGVSYVNATGSCYAMMASALARKVTVRYYGTPWRDEPGYPGCGPLFPYLRDQGREFKFFLFMDGTLYDEATIMECPTANWFGDYWPSDYTRRAIAPLFDHVFAASPCGVRHFREIGCRSVHWLPFACDPDIHQDEGLPRIYDVGFVGQLHQRGYEQRRRWLDALAARYRMNDYTQPVYLKAMARIYAQSKIVVNFPNRGGFNMRVFESMACGAMLLTAEVEGQADCFEDGRHLVTYRNFEDLVRKVEYYLSHDAERQAIAAAGHAEVLARHTYGHRAQRILQVMEAAGDARHRHADLAVVTRAQSIFYSNRVRPDLLARQLGRRGLSIRMRLYAAARLGKCLFDCVRGGRRSP